MSLKIYADPCTVNCRKVLAGCELIGADFELVYVSYFSGGHREPEYVALNPNAMLPALTDGDFTLSESDVILQYIGAKTPGHSGYPSDLRARTDVHRWQAWSSAHWFAACYPYLVENAVKPLLGASPDLEVLDASEETFHRFAAVLDASLEGRTWLVGDHPTFADLSVAAPMHVHTFQKLPLDRYSNIRAWIARIEGLDCWKKTDPLPHFPPPAA